MQKIGVIIPCYNEENRFPINEFLGNFNYFENIDFCFVNDGSTDNTFIMLTNLKTKLSNITVINLENNMGKAEAIRYAVLNLDHSKYAYLGYLDADLSTSLHEMLRLTTFITPDTKFIMGSRIKKLGSIIKRNLFRHIFGRILATFVSAFILKIPVYDTQCGAKLMATPLAIDLFKDPFVSKWLFDVELLLRVIKLKGENYCNDSVIEIPLLKWHDKGDSKIKFIDFINIPFDLLNIYNNYNRRQNV
ncbi:glycosyltransferase [Confluentibacter flavum]|uniref:Family 2 glycosyl transferase n=1 Tax=Confluentibacter flavum TaxID=1909700 RepID=A0A2N3HP15_9FLAO|nr:glycosyltransferase [Confluentibacter flavum]PKQ46733.1 family 2 glycosyl transferase [Confluentibacter flavum]